MYDTEGDTVVRDDEQQEDHVTEGPSDFERRRDAAHEGHIKEKLARGETTFSDDECQFLARHFGLNDDETPFGTQFTEENSPTKGSDPVAVAEERLRRAEESGVESDIEKAKSVLARERQNREDAYANRANSSDSAAVPADVATTEFDENREPGATHPVEPAPADPGVEAEPVTELANPTGGHVGDAGRNPY
jgi:hypothetical protein